MVHKGQSQGSNKGSPSWLVGYTDSGTQHREQTRFVSPLKWRIINHCTWMAGSRSHGRFVAASTTTLSCPELESPSHSCMSSVITSLSASQSVDSKASAAKAHGLAKCGIGMGERLHLTYWGNKKSNEIYAREIHKFTNSTGLDESSRTTGVYYLPPRCHTPHALTLSPIFP